MSMRVSRSKAQLSEYQFYEFRAIDKPLDKAAMAELRRITSRAEITPTSLTNEYHWGGFKGDPEKLVAKYFDAFLYFANWGTHRLMLRVPHSCLDAKALKPYCTDTQVGVTRAGEYTVLDFWSPDDCHEDEWHEWELGALLPLRNDLMSGDLRCLYVAWLSAVSGGDVADNVLEPPVPPGLGKLSGALSAFADFLYLDDDLLAVAAEASAKAPAGPSADDLAAWIASIDEPRKNDWLLRLMQGKAAGLHAEMLAQFRHSKKPKKAKIDRQERRTAGAIMEAYEVRREGRGAEDC
jgi:hypothetical protein